MYLLRCQLDLENQLYLEFYLVLLTWKLNRTISIVLVVSPLTALMMEMKEKFVPRGMDAEFLGEIQEDTDAISRVIKG